ncbi:MAG: DUF4271 domain-containing protein [Cyclobacteriaceae bacterium]|nr:DUF4271 domain-containing protein [Cyclobacteriaceae bacterium]
MWLGFKKQLFLYLLLSPAIIKGQQTDGVVYNLKQNWVQYNVEAESFMPAISQSSGSSISFLVDGEQYRNQKLYIRNSKTVYLFYETTLITKLNAGNHVLDIDSLSEITQTLKPVLTLYGQKVKNKLATLIVSPSFSSTPYKAEEEHIRSKSLTSFFIIISILLLVGLILIKVNSPDLYAQYANFSRALNLTTIDEIIYKGGFFANPSIQLVTWMSFSASFVLYFLMAQLDIQLIEINLGEQSTLFFHSVQLFVLASGFLLFFVLKYILVVGVAYIFDMSSTVNIHFATHLRLTFYLLLFLQTIITLNYFSILPISTLVILFVTFGALFAIIVLIGFRLSFIVRHPFVQIFLYLCGTEIFLFVFVLKLVVG